MAATREARPKKSKTVMKPGMEMEASSPPDPLTEKVKEML
jgi:hypothetical protein